MERSLSALALSLVVAFASPVSAAPVPSEKPTAKQDEEFEKLWNKIDWYQPDAVKFWCRVQASPKAGYAFLQHKIEPIRMSEATAKRLIDELGSDDEATWKAAESRLKLRDIRLGMNFLDAWDYATTDFQKARLTTATFGQTEYPHFYDFDLQFQAGALGQPPFYHLHLKLKSDVPEDVVEHMGLFSGCGTSLNFDELVTPNAHKLTAEKMISRYLIQSPTAKNAALLQVLARGNRSEPTTQLAIEGLRQKAIRKLDAARVDLTGLPGRWDRWCTDSSEPDSLTAELLSSPVLAVQFLGIKLKPIRIDARRVAQLLCLLSHPSKTVWGKAAEEMRLADPRFCLPIEFVWNLASTVEQRQRLAAVLLPDAKKGDYWDFRLHRDNYRENDRTEKCYGVYCWIRSDLPLESLPAEFRNRNTGTYGYSLAETPEEISREKWLREEAAIWVLEAIGTDDALAIVKRMATGHPAAGPTIAAKEVLARRFPK